MVARDFFVHGGLVELFLSEGFGDVFAVLSRLSDEAQADIEAIYWGTPGLFSMRSLFKATPAYAHIRHELWNHVRQLRPEILDCSISKRFPTFRTQPFNPSKFLTVASDLARFNLPARYAVIQHDTTAHTTTASRRLRKLHPEEWQVVIEWLAERDLPGVVLNTADTEAPPDHPRIINLIGQTSLVESVAILNQATAYAGIASCLCVLASQLFDAEHLLVKGPEVNLWRNRESYFAPHGTYPFLFKHLCKPNERPSDVVEVRMLRTRLVLNDMAFEGSLVEMGAELAADYVRAGEAAIYTPTTLHNDMNIKFLKARLLNNVVYAVGDVITLPDPRAREFIATGEAVKVPDAKPEDKKPETKKDEKKADAKKE